MNHYITTRVAIEAFQYDPYDVLPEWWQLMEKHGEAFRYKLSKDKPAYASFFDGTDWITVKIGDKVCIDETGAVFKLTAERFSKLAKPIDRTKEAAPMFLDKIQDAVYQFNEKLRK